MKKIILISFGCLLFLIAHNAAAQRIKTRFIGEVPVAHSSSIILQKALPAALQQVLIKVSGDSNITMIPSVKDALSNANRWMRSYRYISRTNMDNSQQLWLAVKFDNHPILNLLRQTHQSIWGADRPSTLVWLVIQGDNANELLNSESSVAKQTKVSANIRGLPLMFPVLDLQDMMMLSADDITNFNAEKIENASKRYGTKNILAIMLSSNNEGQWQARWHLYVKNQWENGETQGKSLDQLLSSMINSSTDAIAMQWATPISDTEATQLTLRIDGISTLKQYTTTMNYLRQLTTVSDAKLLTITHDDITARLTVLGGEKALTQAIAKQDQLLPENNVASDADLTYRWQS